MNITRVHTERGSHIEPPLDSSWDDQTKLRWLAAVVANDTGLPVEVRGQEWFTFHIASTSTGWYTYREAWIYLTGVSTGARAVRTEALPTPPAPLP